ncbi:MAG: GAF domain-containing protein [Bacillota bacterium]
MFDEKNISKLYRYEALLQAIDFFTQKFNVRQLANYAFDFANEILTLNSSALFLMEGDSFKLVRVRNYYISDYTISNTDKLQRIATFYGNILKSNFDNFFNAEDIKQFDTQIIIPLIIQDLLYGFIISNGKAVEAIDEDDLIISKALMQLINNSLESSKNFSDLQEKNKQLDQKIFNLFSINQSSRMLLSELELNRLYSLSIDIFSELTSSKVTSFGLYDEIKDRIIIKGFRNVYSNAKVYLEFELFNTEYNGYKVVFSYKDDIEQLKRIFVNYEDFEKLEAEYIILIVKNKLLGFVTISKPVNDRQYDEGIFELIESLAASTYISFTNAIFFQETIRQKSIIEQKLTTLTKLNALIKNIHNCLDLNELCDLSIKTLHYAFGIKKAFIALKDNGRYIIKSSVGYTSDQQELKMNDNWKRLHGTEMFYSFTRDTCYDYIDDKYAADIGETNCLVISPIYADGIDIDEEDNNIGYMVVLQTPESLREDELLLIDTISNSIAPIINHMSSVQQLKKDYKLNQQNLFISALNRKFYNKEHFSIDFTIYYKRIEEKPFVEADLSGYQMFENFYFSNYVFILSELPLDEVLFDGVIGTQSIEQVVSDIKSIL